MAAVDPISGSDVAGIKNRFDARVLEKPIRTELLESLLDVDARP